MRFETEDGQSDKPFVVSITILTWEDWNRCIDFDRKVLSLSWIAGGIVSKILTNVSKKRLDVSNGKQDPLDRKTFIRLEKFTGHALLHPYKSW
jgi:hypothetical protein